MKTKRTWSWRLLHVVHNCVAHPLLPIAEYVDDLGWNNVSDIFYKLHDKTIPPEDEKNVVRFL